LKNKSEKKSDVRQNLSRALVYFSSSSKMRFAVQSYDLCERTALQSVSGLNHTPAKIFFALFCQALLIWSEDRENEFFNNEEKLSQCTNIWKAFMPLTE